MDSKMQQAKEWAGIIRGEFNAGWPTEDHVNAAAEVIQSLPDQWVDAEKVQAMIDNYKHARDSNAEGTEGWVINHLMVSNLESLIAPPLPTLAELIEAGNDPQQCQLMQCKEAYFPTGGTGAQGVILSSDETSSLILERNGAVVTWRNSLVTPFPDLPKLEWPGGGAEDDQVVDGEPIMMPRPEDVKPGDYWLVRIGGRLSPVAAERDHRFEDYPWTVLEGRGGDHYPDAYVTLVSRLVPERKENA